MRTVCKKMLFLFLGVAVLVEIVGFGSVIEKWKEKIEPTTDISGILVLGAGLEGKRVSTRLKLRLDQAIEVLNGRELPIIVSGGKGADEDISEAEAMKAYLVQRGIVPQQIYVESNSTSTYENLKYSKALMENDRAPWVIVSSDYHMFRVLWLARHLKIHAVGSSAQTPLYLKLYYSQREVFVLVKDMLLHRDG